MRHPATTPVQTDHALPSRRRLELALALGLALVTFLVYCPVLDFDFVNFDDHDYVLKNEQVRAGLTPAGVWWALTTFATANWHPLTWWSLQLDATLYGGTQAWGFHLTNLLLHLVNTVLLLHVLTRLTGAVWRSSCVAALFALHPLHVESVAWVAERKDVLSTCFWLLTLWGYAVYVERPTPARYALVCLPYALGLLAKPMLVTLPCVLLLLDYWPLGRLRRGPTAPARWRLLAEKLPLFALAAGSSLVTLRAQSLGEAVAPLANTPLDLRLLNALLAYVGYLEKMVWPVDLAVYYPHPGAALPRGQAMAAGLFLLALTALVLWLAARRPYLLVGWFWYLGTLVPVIGLVQVGSQAMADRYTYVPLIGIFLALVWAGGDLALALPGRAARVGAALAVGLLLLGCVVRTWEQLGTWHDQRTLWEHAVRVTRPDYFTHDVLGMIYYQAGEWQKAHEQFRRAVELNPTSAQARNSLGMAKLALGDAAGAATHLAEAVRLRPERADAHHNLALAYVLGEQPDLARAATHARQAVALKPELAAAHALLGYLLQAQGQEAEAASHYAEALRLDPGWLARSDEQAWRLATSPAPPPFAVRLALLYAQQVCQATEQRRVEFLETRAAAEAAAGRFEQAAQTLRQGLALIAGEADPARYRALQERLERYARGQR